MVIAMGASDRPAYQVLKGNILVNQYTKKYTTQLYQVGKSVVSIRSYISHRINLELIVQSVMGSAETVESCKFRSLTNNRC